MENSILQNLGIGLLLGMLVGLERERSQNPIAGVRTFTLITLLGVLAGTIGALGGVWIVPVALAAVLLLLVAGNLVLARKGEGDAGMTTEVAALVMFAVGAALAMGLRITAVVTAGVVALLLHWKRPLHALVKRMGEGDVQAIMRLVLVGLVILPLLPDESYGPYAVLNPFRIWLMVVLIVGISLVSWVVYRLFGARAGTLLSGALGGMISSTAATVSYARRTRSAPAGSAAAAVMIAIASSVVFIRVLFEIAVVAPARLLELGGPLVAMFGVMVLITIMMWMRSRGELREPIENSSPSDLRAAITFALLYGAVLLAVAFAQANLGRQGLYAVAAISGLTDMDAITLSTAQLVLAGQLETATGWRLILIGSMANLVFKAGAVAVLGHRRLTITVAIAFGIAIAGGVLLLLLWPDG
jgi:uncharacterized membrane protein (DUF4010 family)